MSDEPIGDDTKPRSYDVTFLNPLFDFDDDFTLCKDNPLFDEEFKDISSLDPPELTPVIDEPTLLVTLPLPCTDVLGDDIIDIELLLGEQLDILSTGDKEINFNPSNSNSMSRSSETSDLFEELITEIGLDDSIPIGIDNRHYDSEGDILYFEQLLNEDSSSNVSPALLPTESSLLVTPLPDPEQICLREVERFDPFFSLTQMGETMRVMKTSSFGFHNMPSPRPDAYSPKEVMYRFYHPRHTSGDGFDHESENFTGSSPLTQTGMVDFVPGQAVIDVAQRKREVDIRLGGGCDKLLRLADMLDSHCKRVKSEAKCANIIYGFLPFSLSSLGKLEKDAMTLLKRIRKFSVTQKIRARAVVYIFYRISFAISKGVGARLGNDGGLSMVLVDFKNAFNLVDKSVLLEETRVRCPSIAPWVEFCYARPARLYYDDSVLWSCQGVQQGDSLGPLLFALALHPLVRTINQSCKLTFQAWYLVGSTIVGDTLMVAKALDIIMTDGPAHGLFLNVDKTELFWPLKDPRSRVEGVFPINISRPLNDVKLLGGLVSLDEGFCQDLALKRVSKTISLMEAIYKLHDPQCELLLLRNCVGVAKLSYALRVCSPLYLLEAQVQFDEALRASLENIVTASGLGFGDWQWRLAILPIKLGGLGVFSVEDIIQYAFLASRLQTNALQSKILLKLHCFQYLCSLNVAYARVAMCTGWKNEEIMRSIDGKDLRPSDLLFFNCLQGKDACLDVTCISPFAGMGATSWAPGVALHNAAEKNKRKYASICEENGYKFIPFAFSTFGEFDTEALDTLSRIKSISISHSNNAKSGVFIFHRVSFCIQKGVGAQLVSRLLSNFMKRK
ncbi:hypothetical protein Tco_0706111 [Tanacetum coccineum]|uniref:Reverse transcriptase domain-containing protein n=1 Tax=Tanacetum coccineum TaxID=301880 RepID=A0ABQ4Y8G5_9ASTR